MKNLKVVLLAALVATGLASCAPKECENGAHVDSKHTGTCEVCGKTGLPVVHSDENKDHKCDVCGFEMSQHGDTNGDHKCDYCGATISDHVDENPKDHKCDMCGEVISQCADENPKDHYCDICGKKLSECEDKNGDGKCDICGGDVIVESYDLDLSGAKLVFAKDEEFSAEGVKVVGTYTGGAQKDLEFEVKTAPNMAAAGEQEVVLSFKVNGLDKTLTYNIEVVFWDEDAIAIFEDASLFGLAGGFPYMLDLEVEAERDEEGNVESFKVFKKNATEDDVLAYKDVFDSFSKTVKIEGENVEFEPINYPASYFGGLEQFGIDEDTLCVYELIPAIYDSTYKSYERAFISDEYVIFGLDKESGDLVAYNYMVSSKFDGMFGADDLYYGGFWYNNKYQDEINEQIGAAPADVVYNYFTEVGGEYIPSAYTAAGGFMFCSFNTAFPFECEDDLAFEAIVIDGAADEEAALRSKLVALGYVADTEDANIYRFEDASVGSVEYRFTPYSDKFFTNHPAFNGPLKAEVLPDGETDVGFSYTVYYNGPEYFVEHTDGLLQSYQLGYLPFIFETDLLANEFVPDHFGEAGANYVYAAVQCGANFADAEAVVDAITSSMNVPSSFIMTEGQYDEDEGCYSFYVENYLYTFSFTVYEADEEGVCEVYITLSDFVSYSEIYLELFEELCLGQTFSSTTAVLGSYYYRVVGLAESTGAREELDAYAEAYGMNPLYEMLLEFMYGVETITPFGYDEAEEEYYGEYQAGSIYILVEVFYSSGASMIGFAVTAVDEVKPIDLLFQVGYAVSSQVGVVTQTGVDSYRTHILLSGQYFPEDAYLNVYQALATQFINSNIATEVSGLSQIAAGVYTFVFRSFDKASDARITYEFDSVGNYWLVTIETCPHQFVDPKATIYELASIAYQVTGGCSFYADRDGGYYFVSGLNTTYSLAQLASIMLNYLPDFVVPVVVDSSLSSPYCYLNVDEEGEYYILCKADSGLIVYTIYIALASDYACDDSIVDQASFDASLAEHEHLYTLNAQGKFDEATEYAPETDYYYLIDGYYYYGLVEYANPIAMTPEYALNHSYNYVVKFSVYGFSAPAVDPETGACSSSRTFAESVSPEDAQSACEGYMQNVIYDLVNTNMFVEESAPEYDAENTRSVATYVVPGTFVELTIVVDYDPETGNIIVTFTTAYGETEEPYEVPEVPAE